MTTRTKFREETLVWLTRALLAAVVWATVWGLSYMFVPGVDTHDAEMDRLFARGDSLGALQEETNRVMGTYLRVFKNISNRRFDSSRVVRGRDTLLIDQWLELGVEVRVSRKRIEAWSIAAGKDSARIATLEFLGLTPVNREFARRLQTELSLERETWTLLAAALAPPRRQALAALKRVQDNREINRVALDTIYQFSNAEFQQRSLRLKALHDTFEVQHKGWKVRTGLHIVVAYAGIVMIWAFASFAATGRWETLPNFIRRRLEPPAEPPDATGHP